MKSKTTTVCVIVGFLGVAAAALCFAAEAKRIKASQVSIDPYSGCVFPRSTALGLGIGAALALLISQVIVSSETGCFTSKYAKLPVNWSAARRNSFISRIAFGVGIVLLIAALVVTGDGREKTYSTYYYTYTVCYVVKPGIFAAAGIFSLISVGFGVLYYLNLAAGIEAAANTNTVTAPPQAAVYPPPSQAVYPPPQAVYPPPPQAVYPPPPQATPGMHYDVEQPQFQINKPY